jgi:hypothetical protein
MPTIVPAANFTVRKLDGFRVDVDTNQYMLCTGWGLWDEVAQGWVAGYYKADGITVLKPWAFKGRKYAQLAVRDGLIAGYKTKS